MPRHVIGTKITATLIFTALTIWFIGDTARTLVALVAAVILGSYAIRDLINPIRLSADTDGVVINRGFFGERRLAWGEISHIRVDERRRLAGTSVLLEIDIDTTLFLFSKAEIGEEPAAAVDRLTALRATSTAH